jgi:uncharacterized protein
MKPLVIAHGSCMDGFASAWTCHRALGDIEVHWGVYGQPPPDAAVGRNVYIVDFSYPYEVMMKLAETTNSLVVLDHHKTACDDLLDFEEDCRELGYERSKVRLRFDMDKSGGRLTWQYFFGQAPAPWLIDYTEDRDLWRFHLPASREINAYLKMCRMEFDTWDNLMGIDPMSIVPRGEAVLAREKHFVEQHVKYAVEIDFAGYKIPCVNATALNSEIAGELARGHPFAACYFDSLREGKRVWSLRSERDVGIDVSVVAKAMGGGGHRHAAGFTVPLPQVLPETMPVLQHAEG